MERNEVSLHIQSECGKIRTRKTPNTDTFYAVISFAFLVLHCCITLKFHYLIIALTVVHFHAIFLLSNYVMLHFRRADHYISNEMARGKFQLTCNSIAQL